MFRKVMRHQPWPQCRKPFWEGMMKVCPTALAALMVGENLLDQCMKNGIQAARIGPQET